MYRIGLSVLHGRRAVSTPPIVIDGGVKVGDERHFSEEKILAQEVRILEYRLHTIIEAESGTSQDVDAQA